MRAELGILEINCVDHLVYGRVDSIGRTKAKGRY